MRMLLLALDALGDVNVETALLWAAFATTLAGLLACALYVRGQGAVHFERAKRLAQVGAGLLTINLALMLYDFIALNLAIEYVHSYTQIGAPLAYRIAGLWGGQKGTILMWGTFSALLFVINQSLWDRKSRAGLAPPMHPRNPRAWTLLVGLGIVLAFTFLMILGQTWERTDAYLLSLRPDGVGLQPVLRTPFMVIHPPLQFVGYALTTILFASAFAYLVTRDKHWADLALPWARLTFLIEFIGLGLGGLWAYYVLNFGGYWAWDPVETANLIALFPTILTLHALLYYRKRNMFQATAPLFCLLTFLATLFSSIATRSGLWVSVHAFTDPTQNFTLDPLARFLNILQASGPILQFLTAMLLAGLLAAVLAYLWRIQADAAADPERPRPWTRRLTLAGVFLVASLFALTLLDPAYATSLLFQVSHAAYPPNASIGLALLTFAFTLALAAPALTLREEPAPAKTPWMDRWINTPNLVFIGVLFISLAFLVTFLLDIMSVNGYHRSVYDLRAPLVALPILLTMGLAFLHPTWGKQGSLALTGASLGLGILLAALFPSEWQLALVLPALLFALLGASVKLFKVSDQGAKRPARLRVAGAILLFGGIATLAYWANPPTRLPLPGLELHPSPWWAAVGYPLGLLSILGGVSALRADNYRLAQTGAVALAAGFAWLLGPLLGLASLALQRPYRSSFARGHTTWDLNPTFTGLQREYRKTGVYLIHVFLVLGLAGYAASTYLQPEDETLELVPEQVASSHGYEFSLRGTTHGPLDPRQRIINELTAHVEIARDGRALADAPLTMWLELTNHYAERVQVERYPLEDVYVRPNRFVVQQATGSNLTFNAHDDNVRLFPGDQVVEVVFTVRTLPGMHLVWAGLWGVGTGMLMSLIFGGFRFEAKTAGGASQARKE